MIRMTRWKLRSSWCRRRANDAHFARGNNRFAPTCCKLAMKRMREQTQICTATEGAKSSRVLAQREIYLIVTLAQSAPSIPSSPIMSLMATAAPQTHPPLRLYAPIVRLVFQNAPKCLQPILRAYFLALVMRSWRIADGTLVEADSGDFC